MLLEKLNDYYNRKLLVKQSHPILPLTIWNYSRTCQFERVWDEITLMCRGLITNDITGEIVARPFPKFFNWEEHKENEIPNEPFDVFTKEDGSLGIVFKYNGNWMIASRGSFISEQAEWANNFFFFNDELQSHVENSFKDEYTYLVEIVYKSNRIVVDYGDYEGLILLSAIETLTGVELPYDELLKYSHFFYVVKRHDGVRDFKKLKSMVGNNEEGFIIRFKSGLRMKIKGDEYVRLHRILTNISTTDIWETLKSGGDLEEMLQMVPDEFDAWVRDTIKDLVIRFENIRNDYTKIFDDIYNKVLSTDRKAFAEEANRYKHPSILFKMLDGGDCSEYIWNVIKPKFSKAFKTDS
jgi:RNA ligase